MKVQLKILRNINDQQLDLGILKFNVGDYYNIYQNMVAGGDFSEKDFVYKFLAFKITDVDSNGVSIQNMYFDETFKIKLNETVSINYEEYGVYEIKSVVIEA